MLPVVAKKGKIRFQPGQLAVREVRGGAFNDLAIGRIEPAAILSEATQSRNAIHDAFKENGSGARFHASYLPTEIFEIFGLRQQRHEVLVLPIRRSKRTPLQDNNCPGNDGKNEEKQKNDFRHRAK